MAFAVLARALRGVSPAGAIAGGVACFLLLAGAGPGGFLILALLFAMTWGSTRIGYHGKQVLGVAERREGRSAWQVLANLAAPAACAAIFGYTGNRAWLIASVAALAEAATDTVASEIGQAGKAGSTQTGVRMITTWKSVPPGTDGGMSLPGTLAGVVAGLLLSVIALALGMLPVAAWWIPVLSGFAGMLLDSVLGATLQRKGWLSNQGVNLVSTLAAAALAYAIAG